MAFRSISAVSTGTSVVSPAGVANNDIVVLVIAADDDITVTDWGTNGFTLGGRIAAGGDYCTQWGWKVAGGSEPGTYSFTLDFNTTKRVWSLAFSGRDTAATPTGQSTTISSQLASPMSVALTGLTPTAGSDLIWFPMLRPNTSTDRWNFTAPSGFTEQDESASDFLEAQVSTKDNHTGATGTLSANATITTGTDTARFAGWVIALAPATASDTLMGQACL